MYSNSAQNINKNHGSLSLSFDQQLSKLTFNLRREDGTVAGLESFSIALQGFYNTAKFDLASGEIFDKLGSSQPINLGTSREAIVIPHTDPIAKSFKFHIGASEWIYDLPLGDTFEPGKKYDYTITISAHAVDVELTTISPWILDSTLPTEGGLDSNPIEYAYIPPGTFQMGAPDSSTTANSNAKPQHWVKISKGFFMSKHEITVTQYAEFLNANHVEKGSSSQVSHLIDGTIRNLFNSIVGITPQFINNKWVAPTGRENYPMCIVTWYGALAYAKWRGGTLPTEAQWEYAYRAGTKNKFFAGNLDAEMMDYAWYIQNSGGNTHPVGQKKPNPWGLYDMAGNVTEWCLDVNVGYYITAYPSAPNELFPIVDPGEFEDSAIRAYRRGGDFLNSAYFSSAYARIFREKNDLVDNVGFRIVINP